MYIHPCRYNLIEGELRIDTQNEQIVFIRHSLGEKEIYATWSLAEVKKFEIKSGLLTLEVVLILQSSKVLRFSSNEIQPNIKDWIENRKPVSPKKSNSKPSANQENKSTQKEITSQNRPKKKKSKRKAERKKSKQTPFLESTVEPNSLEHIKENLENENTEIQDDVSTNKILDREEKKTSLDSSHDVKETDSTTDSSNDIANIFREMKNDLTSNQSSFEDNTGTNITHKINTSTSSLEEDDTEQKSCCSNWIVWLIVFLFLVQCLGN